MADISFQPLQSQCLLLQSLIARNCIFLGCESEKIFQSKYIHTYFQALPVKNARVTFFFMSDSIISKVITRVPPKRPTIPPTFFTFPEGLKTKRILISYGQQGFEWHGQKSQSVIEKKTKIGICQFDFSHHLVLLHFYVLRNQIVI